MKIDMSSSKAFATEVIKRLKHTDSYYRSRIGSENIGN